MNSLTCTVDLNTYGETGGFEPSLSVDVLFYVGVNVSLAVVCNGQIICNI